MTQQDNESRKWLYDKFTESGLNVGKDYAEFSALMDSNEESRQWAFDQAQSMGLNVGADFGQFSSLINPQQQDEPEDANSVTFPISRTFSAGHEVSRIEDTPGYTPTEPQTPQTEAPAPKQEEDSKPKGLGLIFKQPESQEQTKAGTYAWKNIVFGEQQDQYGVEKYRKQAEQQAKERPSFNEWMKQLEDYSDAEHVAMTDPNYIPPTEEQTAERNAAITDIERRIDEHEARLKDYNARYPEGWKPATQEEADKANKEAQAINEEAKKLSADCEAFMSADKNEYYDRTVSARAAKKSGEVAEYSRAYVSKGWTYAQDAELRNMRAEALNIEDADKRAEALKAYKLKAEELLGKGGGDAFENYVQDDSVNMLDNDLQRKVRKTDAAYKRAYDRAAKAQEEYRKRYNAPHPGVTTHGLTPEAEQQRAEDLAALDEVQNATAERTALWAAKQIESRSARTIENYNEQKTQRTQGTYVGNTLSNLSSSFGQRITDFSNWDFGLSDLMEMSALQKAVEKADNGEALSEGEEILLNAAASNMAIQGAADLGLSFTAGQVTAEAVPFIIQMIVDPAAAVGKGTAAGVARYAMKRAVASGTKALASKAGRKALRFGSRAIGLAAQFAVDTASGAGVAANTGQGKVLAGMKEKQVGEIDGSFDDNGNFVYNGHVGDDAALAYIKSFAEWTIENQSERIGDSFIDPLEDVIKSTIGKTATKIGTKVAPKMTEKAVQVLSAIDRKNWQHAVKEIAERAHFNGIIGETAEEIIGSAEKNLLGIGDEPITWDSTKDTFLTMIPMQVMFGVLGMGGAAIEKIPSARKVSAKRSLAASMLGDRWQEIENAIDGAKEDNLSELLKGYMTDETMSVPERRAIAEYAIAKQAHIGVEKAKNLWREHDTNEAVFGAAYDRGYNELTSDEDRLSMSIISQQMMQEAMANEEIAPYLPLLQTDPSRAIAEMQQAGVSEESMRLAGQTVNAIRSAQGIAAKMKDESMARVETFNTQIDQFTHRDGNIYRITDRMGNPAYLREGNLSSPDNTIIIVTEDGKVQMSYADNWTASDSSKAEDVKAENEAQESAFLESEINRVLGGRIGEVQVGQTIAVPMQGGEVKQYVVAGQNESGNYELVDEYGNPLLEEDGKPLFVGMEQIQQMSDYLAATAAEAKRSEWFGENEPAEPEATAEEETEEEDTSEIRSTEPEETKNNTRYNVGDTFTIDIPDGSSIEGEITYIDEDGTIDVRYSEPVGGMTEETISLNQLENMIAEYRPIPKVEPSAENQQEIIPTGQGFFGKIYNQFKGEAKQAFDFLFAKKEGDLLGVFHRNDIGDIDLVWGDRTKNMGLEHIIDKHVGEGKDFANEREVALVIDDVINNGDAVKDDEYHFEIVKDGYIVSLRKSFDGVKKNWVVTSFKLQDPTSKKPLSNVTLSSPDINEGSRSVTPNSGISGGKVNKNSATIQENAEKNALSRIPLNESGQPDYVKADPETAWDALVERNDGDAAAAQQDADDIVAVKQARLNAVSREKAKKPNIPVNATDEDILNANKAYRQQQKVIDERIATAQSELNAWKRIAFVQRKRRDEAEIEAARQAKEAAKLREAEEAARKIAEETAARIEREKLHGVPDWIEDKPQDARQRGYRRVTGQMVERQTPDVAASQGKEIQVKFDKNNIVSGHATLVEASALQPSHIQGKRNPLHFLDEAQPKERTDKASVASAQDIAHNIRPEEITSSVTAYTGAPTVNARGEVIQGNNRSDALRYMWENPNGESAQLYKQYLLDHAEDFGLNREDIEKMQAPVLVNMLDVNDDEAIKLGQFTAANTESGGNERISAKHTVQFMGSENMSMFAQRLLNGSEEDEDASITDLINNNGLEVLKWMLAHKFITQTQYQSALEDGTAKLNDNAVSDLKDILFQSIFQGGSTQLETMFKKLPIKAQKAILATSFRDYDSKKEDSVLGEVQNSIVAFNELMKDPMFADAKNLESARNGIEAWKRQYQIDDSTGESYLPTEKFSNFALLLAATYKGESQKNIQQIFNELYDTIQGVQEEDLFAQDETAEPMPLPDAIKKVIKELLNIDIEYNGQQGSNLLGDNTQTSEEGQRGRNQDARSGEQNPTGERLDDSRRGTEDVGDGDRGGQTDSRYNRERQDNLGKTEGVKLSEEKDENGLSFVLSSEGTTEFGHIDDKSTLPPAPIKLSIGFNNVDENGNNIGYGLEHIKAGHGAQILKSGYSSVEEFVEKVTRNYKEIRVGRNRKSNKTFMLLQLHDEKHKQTIFVELSHDGSYWNVNSGGIFKNKYTDKNDIVWLEPTVESNASTDTTEVIDSPANAVEGETVDRGGNSSQSISEHKVTENSANDQTNSEENVEKNADGVEKLENDASNEQLTGIQKANAPELQSRIAEAEAETDTNPTEAQKKAGNYKKGHVTIGELDITIENPKGSTRSGVDENGNPWSNTMHNTYGYILGTEGVDGDHIDVFLADDMDAWDGKKVFIVDQKRRSGDSFSKIDIDGEEVDLGFEVSEMEFDEHKVMLGFNDKSSALDAYLSNYDEGWYAEQDGVDISSCSIEDFNKWIKSSHRKTKPFAEYSSVKSLENEAEDDNILFRDAEYSKAVENGDNETAQKLLDEKAEEVFKDSQVRDEEGKLLKVYHGTTEDFNAFDIEQSRKNSDIQGMFFSPWVEDAQGYGGNVRVFYLNSKKLADEQTAWKAFKRFRDTGEDNAGVKAREYLQSLGYDGVNRNGEEYIIFDSNNIKSADPITYDDNGDVIPLSERFNEETDDLRFRFIGEKGAKSLDDYNKGRRIDFLKYAKYLEKEGRSEKDIKLQTGWERGADGKWRYETPDDLLSRDNLLELANGNYIHHMLGYFLPDNSEFTEAYPELYSTHVILKELPEGKKGNYSPDSRGGVIQLAMPKGLAEAKKMLGDIEDVLNNGYSEEQKASAEALGVELNTPEQLEASRESILKEIDKMLKGINETFVHEVQHAIQHIEGFANGGNLSMFSMDDTDKLVYEARKFAGLLKKGTEEEREAINVIEKYMDKEVESASEGEMLTQALDSLRESDHGLEYLDIMKQLVKTDTNYNGYIDSRFKKYFALAGEVEARNVTRRIDMTEDERNMSLASETEDMPRDEQIVRNGNDVSASIIEDEDLQKGNAGDAAREAHEIWTFNQRLSDWLAQDNLDWAKGKTRQEIFKKFGNEPEPLFYIHPNYLKYFDGEIKDNRVYCGKGYFIDHAANSHPEVGTEHYADIQNFLNNPDEVKLDNRNGRKSLIFIKKDGDYYMEIVSADNSDKGRIVFHKTMHYKHNKPHSGLKNVAIEKSLVNGTLTISPAKAAAVHRNISSLNDDAKIANNSGSSKNNAENLAESPRNIGTESGNAMSDAENAQAVADSLGLDVEVMTSTDGLSGRKANAKGWFDTKTGKIVIVMPNHSDMEDVMRTILHEGVAHYGLRKLCGEHFDTFLDNVYNNASDEIREEIDKRSASMPESKNADERRRIATEEYLAELAEETDFEDAAFKSWWQRIKAFFSEMLEKAGLRLADKLTDNDLRYYLWRSYKNLKDGGVMDYIGTAEDIAKQAELGVGNYRQEQKVADESYRFRDGEPTFGEKISKARTSAVRALNAMAFAEHKRNKSEETLRLAREAVANFISIGLASGNMTHVGKLDLQKMLTMVKNVPNYKTLSRYLELSQTIISNAEINAQRKAIDDLLKLRKQKQNQKGVSEATAVDDKTRMVFEYMHGRTKELLLTPIDEELNGVNKEIYAIRKQLPELSGDEKDTAIDRIKELSEQAKALRERRKELTAENRSEVEKLWRERMEFLNAKLADDNEDLTDDEMNELEALTILKMINDADLMESVGTVDSETGARGLSIKGLTERKDELAREIHDLYDKRRNTPDREAKKAVTAEIKAKENEIDQCDVIINSIKQKQADLLTSAAEAMRQIVEDGRDRLRSQLTAERERKGDIIRNGYNDIKRGKSWVQRDSKGRIIDREQRQAGFAKLVHSIFASPLESLAYMTQNVSTALSGMGWLYRRFVESEVGVVAAERKFDAAMKSSDALVNEASRRILGMDFVKAADEFGKVYNETGIFIWNRDEMVEEELRISKGTAMYLYQLWNMADGKMKLQDMGFAESSIAQILDFIGEDLRQMADWMVDEFYPQLRERMNERHKEIYHTSMSRIDNYVPIKIDRLALTGKTDLNSGTAASYSESLQKINGSLINRTVNTMPIDLSRTAFDILLEHANQNEEWIAFARVRQDLSYLLNSPIFRNTMNANNAGSYRDFEDAIRVATNMPSEPINTADYIANAISGGYVTGAIAFRPCTALKQTLSYPAFIAYSQNPKFLALLVRNIFTPYTNYTWAKKNSPIFAKRIEDGLGGDSDISRELSAMEDSKFKKFLTKYGKIGMMPNKLVDGLTYSAGSRAIYQYEYDRILSRLKKQGMEEEEAKTLAHEQAMMKADIDANSSQQSSVRAFLSKMQKDKTFMSRMLSVFKQSVIGYGRRAALAATNIARYIGNHDKLVIQYMNNFGVEQKEAEDALNNRVRKDVVTLAIFGFGLNWIWDMGNDVIAQMLGLTGDGDDDEFVDAPENPELEEVKKYLTYISYFFQGNVFGSALHDLASYGKYNPTAISGKLLDAGSDVKKLWNDYGASPEAFFGTLLKVVELFGVSPETFANVVIATDDLITNGRDANIALDVAFILNTTKTTRERIARSRAESFDPLEYAEVMTFALKQKDYGSLGNILLGTRVPKDNSKVKQYFDEWTNKHIGAETNARWTDEGAELMKQYRKYKVKTGAKTGMTEEEKAEFAEAHKELLKDGINTKKETPNAWLNHLELVDQYIRDAEGWLNNELKSGDMDETVVNNLVAFIAAAKKKGAELLDADSEIDSFSLEYTNFKAMLKDNQ